MRRRESTLRQGSQPVKGSDGECRLWAMKTRSLRKKVLYLSVNVLSLEILAQDTIFTSPTGDETVILPSHPSHSTL